MGFFTNLFGSKVPKELNPPELIAKNKEIRKQREETQNTEELKAEVNELRLQQLMKKVAEQDIIIRRLLELVVANIEHKAYDRHLLPKIHAIKNLLDKK